jgi:hypothetical protein
MTPQPVFAISPHYATLDFPNGMTLENKIDVFADRINGWQIGIAKQIIQHKIEHSDFALLQIVFCYFEMIGKYRHGYLRNDRSTTHFKQGVKATFPEIGPDEESFLNTLYDSVRNGLYHLGMTKINVMLNCDGPGSIGYNAQRRLLVICPARLVADIDMRFQAYLVELRNPGNGPLRRNFEARFDFDNSDASL